MQIAKTELFEKKYWSTYNNFSSNMKLKNIRLFWNMFESPYL